MGLKKAYEELLNDPSFRDGFTLPHTASQFFDGGAGSDGQPQFFFESSISEEAFEFEQRTTDVSTSSTSVWSPNTLPPSKTSGYSLVFVVGNDGSGNEFGDLVLVGSYGINYTVVAQSDTGASSRTYNTSSNSLQLAMGSGTYDIVTRGMWVIA